MMLSASFLDYGWDFLLLFVSNDALLQGPVIIPDAPSLYDLNNKSDKSAK